MIIDYILIFIFQIVFNIFKTLEIKYTYEDKLKELYKIYPHLDPAIIEKSIKPFVDSYYKIISFAIPSILPISFDQEENIISQSH